MLHGVARRKSASASGVIHSRTSSRLAWKPPVARTRGHRSGGSRSAIVEPDVPRLARERLRERPCVEPDAGGAGVAGRALDDPGATLLEPGEVVVETLVDEPLELDSAPGAFAEEVVELAVAPDDAAGEEHRAARPVALLVDDDFVPRDVASTAATRPARPAPATTRSGTPSAVLDQREAGLVLDVLEADAIRAAQEHGERVGRVHDVFDVQPAGARLLLDAVGAVDEEREVVEERAIALVCVALAQHDVPVVDGEPVAVALEPELGETRTPSRRGRAR